MNKSMKMRSRELKRGINSMGSKRWEKRRMKMKGKKRTRSRSRGRKEKETK